MTEDSVFIGLVSLILDSAGCALRLRADVCHAGQRRGVGKRRGGLPHACSDHCNGRAAYAADSETCLTIQNPTKGEVPC